MTPCRPMIVASLAIHIVLLGVFPLLLADFGRAVRPAEKKKTEIVFYRRPASRPEPLPIPVEPAPRPTPAPARPQVARPVPPRPAPPRESPVELASYAPRVEPRPAPIAPPRQPAPPRPQVRSAGFGESAPATAAAKPATREIRTAGFGVAEAQTVAPAAPTHRASGRIGGFEVLSDVPAARPGAAPRGRVASTGFDVPASDAAPGPAASAGGSVSTGSFGDTIAVTAPTRRAERPVASPETPVEILSKPKPNYTTEARERRVEGEVVLEVVFGAGGQMRVVRVVRGLGYGLDEAAAEAARQITFEPARRSGTPVDHTATLRIVFQLA